MHHWQLHVSVSWNFKTIVILGINLSSVFWHCYFSFGVHFLDSLIVKFGWRDNDKDRYRFPFTVTPIICSLIICIIPLFGKHYNYNGTFFCDISASPLGCDFEGSTTQCTRGANSRAMLLYVGVIPFMVAFAVIIAAVIVLIYSVLKQERRMDRYQHGDTSLNRSMTRQTTRQGIYYILAFGLAWLPWYICEWRIPTCCPLFIFECQFLTVTSLDAILEYSQGYVPPALGIIHYITMPLQGVVSKWCVDVGTLSLYETLSYELLTTRHLISFTV